MTHPRFAGATVIVTGAAAGIGQETARRFAAEGANVALFDRDDTGLKESAELIGAPGRVAAHTVDVTVQDGVTAAVTAVAGRFGALDVLVNCAGGSPPAFFAEAGLEFFDQVLATNLKSAVVMSRAVWPHLAGRGGVIINTGSISGSWPIFGLSAYGAAKAAVISLTQTMAIEGGPDGIRVNAVTPGYTLTSSFQRMIDGAGDPAAFHASIAGQSALGRMGTPADLAAAYLFLASPDASYITGHNLVVDGGVTLGQLPSADPRKGG